MRTVTVATAGHIDHGKSALVRALTGTDPDRLPEEKRRGITIDIGFAHLDLSSDLRLAIVDVPGHEAFVRNMMAGASGVDLGLLVIAADEGVMPQTREHLAILELLGVEPAAVVLSKADRVEHDWLELVLDDVRQQLRDSCFARAPIIATSVQTGEGLDELRAALFTAAAAIGTRAADDLFRLPIDRVFSVSGTGTVVTGTVSSGSIRLDEYARLLPSGLSTRVKGLQRQGVRTEEVRAGERAAIALAGLAFTAAARGAVLVTDADWEPARMLTVQLQVLAHHIRPLQARDRVHLHLGTASVVARIRPLASSRIEPGSQGWAVLRLEESVVARAGDRFILRSYSPVTTIAGGIVYETSSRPYRRRANDLADLDGLSSRDWQTRFAAALRLAGWRGLSAAQLPVALHPPIAREPAALILGGNYYNPALLTRTAEDLILHLERLHADRPRRASIELERFRLGAPRGASSALRAAAEQLLVDQGRIVVEHGTVKVAEWAPRLTHQDADRLQQIRLRFEQAGLAPPALNELGEATEIMEFLRLLEAQQAVVQLTADLFVDRAALLAAAVRLEAELKDGRALTPAELRDLLGVSRRYLIPLLEYFDRRGLTRRIGNHRTLLSPQAVSDLLKLTTG